jgi:hypothetical protein
MTGPGAVLVGLSIGAGEIVIWPGIAAEYGAGMIWAAALGVFIQLWINIEIGRWAIATGESCYTGFARLWRGWVFAFILLNIAGWLLPGWARASGQALRALIFRSPTAGGPDWVWTGVTFLIVAGVLFGPKRIYVAVERTIVALVILITIGLIVIAFQVASVDLFREMGAGLMNVGHIDPGIEMSDFFSAFVFAGAGGTANLFYAYYLRDKQIGMGARVPMLLNPFRQRQETAVESGYAFPDDETNRRRFRDWFNYVKIDQTLYFWLLNTFTILLFIFAALGVLHATGRTLDPNALIWSEGEILVDLMGESGRYLFLLIGLATLFSTQMALTDGVARTLSDLFTTNFTFMRGASHARWYMRFAVGIMVFGTALTWILEVRNVTALGFLFNAAYIGGFAMAIFTPLCLWMNVRHLPKSARPGPINAVMTLLASAVYVGLALICLGEYVKRFWGS